MMKVMAATTTSHQATARASAPPRAADGIPIDVAELTVMTAAFVGDLGRFAKPRRARRAIGRATPRRLENRPALCILPASARRIRENAHAGQRGADREIRARQRDPPCRELQRR